MPNNTLGELRRSSVVSTFGPGAIVDFRVGEAPISGVIAGLEEWDRRSPPPGTRNPQTVFEPRLQKRLSVTGFRLPPVNVDDDEQRPSLLAVRFPQWLQCPSCHVLKVASRWNKEPGEAARTCGLCTASAPGRRKVFVIPVRFVCACEDGHLDEFPWHFWVQHRPHCTHSGPLKLKSEGAGLGGLILRCEECQSARSMEGVFSKTALAPLDCLGRRPWLASADQTCDRKLRALQRGASNLYFPVSVSAIDIPPWSDNVQKMLGQYWDPIRRVAPGQRAQFIETLAPLLSDIDLTPDELARQVEERVRILESPEADNLRWDEYLQFTSGHASSPEDEAEFEIRPELVPQNLRAHFDHIVRVVRLREVRALSGFTRINPPPVTGDGVPMQQTAISIRPLNWLPAIEVRGEGIFLALSTERLRVWESQPSVLQRASRVHEAFVEDWKQRFGESSDPDRTITGRFLVVHTLAHVLMRQLSLECGYSTASLRERLFVGKDATDMCGLLVYTATTDADGTLGGLARQGQAQRIQTSLQQAIRSMRWCSTDPLCIAEMASAPEQFNLAACHACVLAPETCCEEYNRFLDRATLVGTPSDPEVGYFSDLLGP